MLKESVLALVFSCLADMAIPLILRRNQVRITHVFTILVLILELLVVLNAVILKCFFFGFVSSACSTVLLPEKVVQALNLNFEDMNVNGHAQPRFNSAFATDYGKQVLNFIF